MDGMQRARELIAEELEKRTGFLDLGNLDLTELPEELGELVELRSLNLGRLYQSDQEWHPSANSLAINRFESIPSVVSRMRNLTALSVQGVNVSDLGDVRSMSSLQSLICGSTRVTDLAPLCELPALKLLNCSNSYVTHLSPLHELRALEFLDLSGTVVADLSPLRELPALQHLSCSATRVVDLSPIRDLPALQQLYCTTTQVVDLSPLRDLPALQRLDCSATRVSDFAPLRKLPALQHLDCRGIRIADLSPLCEFHALQHLDCSSTQVADLSPLRDLDALRHLDFWGTRVADLAPLRELYALQHLNCSSTEVTDLSPLRGLLALRHLSCWGTRVADISPLQELSALQQLNCASTQVTDLSPVLNLPSLQQLNCSRTPVADLSPLRAASRLQLLHCEGTRVRDLAPLRELQKLEQLHCSDAPVFDLTPLLALEHLAVLSANRCPITDIPRPLLFSPPIQALFLHETPLSGIPREALSSADHDDCLVRLQRHVEDLEAGAEEIREAKLVVLGNGRIGKTQLCRRLRGIEFDESVPSTHGITVTCERWSGSAEGDALNIWDFGGQDIYHGAHTLFMQTSAIFLIVWHPDFEESNEHTADELVFRNYPLSYWLEYVRTLGRRDSPVVVVQTRCERPEQEVKKLPVGDEFLEFASLKQCWYSAKTARGRGALEDALRDAIESLRSRVGIATIGAGRMRVLRRLEAWKHEDLDRPAAQREHRTLSWVEFRSLCDEAGGVSSPESLLEYLHNIGVVFHRPELFHDRIILDQSWALEAVYAVFDRRKAYPLILSQGGRFTRSLLELTAWREYDESEQRLFLSLMQSCGVAFVHRTANERLQLEEEYLAPDMLPDKQAVAASLDGRWSEDETTRRLEYEYPFLHSGLMRALICDVGARSQEAGVYWKGGVWLYERNSGCRAQIEQHMFDDRRGRITIALQGGRQEELGRWLRQRIEDRNRLFGYPHLAPTIDELGPETRVSEPYPAMRTERRWQVVTEIEALDPGVRSDTVPSSTREPAFAKPPVSIFPARGPEVFVSYAWGDSTPEGLYRAKLVDDLCTALARRGLTVRRDREVLRPGNLISEFMDRLADGDVIVAVISDKYLRSEYCMYELFRIYRNCADRPERFLRKVIPLILPDAALGSMSKRLARAIHWTEEEKRMEPMISAHLNAVGTKFFGKYRLVGEFARNTSDMLELLVDKLQPREFERQAEEGFEEVLAQVRAASAG